MSSSVTPSPSAKSTAASLTPEFLWAQRKDQVYLTINVPNVKKDDSHVTMTEEGRVFFKGPGGNVGHEDVYELDIILFKPIKVRDSQFQITARDVRFKLIKDQSGPYWDRLLKSEGRNVHCKIDWNHWKDEDEDEDDYSFSDSFAGDSNKDLQDMDFVSGASSSDEEDSATLNKL